MSSEFAITARAPVIRQGIDTFSTRLDTEDEKFTITAGVGFDKASFDLRGSVEDLRAWFRGGLARDVVFRAPDSSRVWEGYVSRLTLVIGASTRVQSLDQLANRIFYVYRPLDTSDAPPGVGAQTSLTTNNAFSQAQFGVKTMTISGGEKTAAAATAEAAALLAEMSHLWEDGSERFSGSSEPALRVEMLGYAHMLNWNNYSASGAGTVTRSALVQAIVVADPNGILSSDYTNVAANGETVEQYRDGSRPSWGLIQDVGQAGSSYRWVAGVYEGRRLHYKQAEGLDAGGDLLGGNRYEVITRNLYDPGERFFDRAGRELLPWQIRPDRLLRTTGLSAAPQYIEQVTFSTPRGLEVRSTDANPLRQVVRI